MKIPKTPEVKRLAQATYPEYKGRKFQLAPFEGPRELRSFWDEGSRTYYKFVNVDTLEVHELHSNHPFYEANKPHSINELPPGVVLVANLIFCGEDKGLIFYVRPDEMPKFLPLQKEVA